jgi:hypothetical protein
VTMHNHADSVEALLRHRLQPARIPRSAVVWLAIQPRLCAPRRGTPVLRVAVVVALVLALSASLALASPNVRDWLGGWLGGVAVSMGGPGGRVDSLYPAPPFTVMQPPAAPDGWTLLANGYNPGPDANGLPSASLAGGAVARRVDGQDVPPPRSVVEQAQARAQDLLAGSEAVFALVYADSDGHLTAIRERTATGRSFPAGETTRVGDRQAVVSQQGLILIVDRTYIEISGSASPEIWMLFGRRLEPTTLAPFDTPPSGQAAQTAPTPPAWTRLALSARLGARILPVASAAQIAQQCGWDPSLSSRAPGEAMLQVRCAARLAGGIVDEQGGSSVSQLSWLEAARQMGIDPGGVIGADTRVYLVQLDVSAQGGTVVVIDSQTAQPYLVAALTPAPTE